MRKRRLSRIFFYELEAITVSRSCLRPLGYSGWTKTLAIDPARPHRFAVVATAGGKGNGFQQSENYRRTTMSLEIRYGERLQSLNKGS